MKPFSLALFGMCVTFSAFGLSTPAPHIDSASGQFTTNQITVQGTEAGGSAITSVQYLLNGSGPYTATQPNTNNWNKWQATIALNAGSNLFQVWAVGTNGLSATNTGHYFLLVEGPITVSLVGSGHVNRNYNGKMLIVGRSYTMVATPGKGQVFAGWSGTVTSEQPSLTFQMQSNENLTATFEASPFTNGVAGVYDGLFSDSTDLVEGDAGYLTLTLGADGKFSGSVALAGQTSRFSSQFRADGSAQWTIQRPRKENLSFSVALDLSGVNGLSGTVNIGGTNASVQAYQELEEASNYDGSYNWTMNGAAVGNSGPEGHSYGTATVAPGGKVVVYIFLSDGTTAFVSGKLTRGGPPQGALFPLYVSLYARQGSLSGWLTFTHNGLTLNSMDWFKNAVARGPYTNGFALTGLPMGLSPYQPGTNTFGTSNIVVSLSGGDLIGGVTDFGTFDSKGIVPLSGSSNGVVSLNLTNGVFAGSFIDPASGKTIPIHGALVQPAQEAFGFFSTTNHQSGDVGIIAGPR